jgi:BirA family biotin operon repressor/biotin-[acetyl-CoA-carboxylase] ligase
VVGVSVAERLAALGVTGLALKWPNDLWLGAAKLGGILIETATSGAQRYAVVGVGLNLRRPEQPLPEAAGSVPAVPPAGLQSVVGLSAPQVLGAVVPALMRDLLHFQREGWPAFAQRFAALDGLAGRRVRLSDGREGVACGLGAGGALRVQTATGLIEALSGEVSVRPQD